MSDQQPQQKKNIGWINIKSKNGGWVISGSFRNAQEVEYDLGYSIAPSGRAASRMIESFAIEMGLALAGKGTKRKNNYNNQQSNNQQSSNQQSSNQQSSNQQSDNDNEDDIPF